MAAAAALRPPTTGLGPLLPGMTADVGLTAGAASALTTAPILCFALGAIFAPWVIRRLGIDRTVILVLLTLAVLVAVRPWAGYAWLLIGTIAAALVVSVGNVMMPVIIRARHHASILTVTGLYSVALAMSASLSAGAAVPLADWLGGFLGATDVSSGGWRASLAFWALPTLVAAAVWMLLGREPRAVQARPASPRSARPSGVARYRTAWLVSLYFGIQGIGFYAFITWYPTVLVRRGLDDALAGGQLSLALACGAVAALVVPLLARRFGVALFIVLSAALILLGALGVLSSSATWIWVFSVSLGCGQGGTLPLSLSLVSSRAADAHAATGISALLNVVGYVLAALGPVLGTVAYRTVGSWDGVLVLLAGIALVQGIVGVIAHRAPLVRVESDA